MPADNANSARSSASPDTLIVGGEPVLLARRIEIFPQNPLPALSSAAGTAYAARIRSDTKANLYAIVCSESLPFRGEIIPNLLAHIHSNLVKLRDSGSVAWATPAGGTIAQHVLVFERPQGERVGTAYIQQQKPTDEERLTSILLGPIVQMIGDMNASNIGHGGICLDNLYTTSDGTLQAGECVSCPPSYSQPSVYQTIERAQCSPAGRGTPTTADDIYALGVTALIMTLGFNPVAHLSDEEIINLKLDRGSFSGLLGENRVKGSMAEMFRGLLADNERQRWTINDLEMWLGGRRPNSKPLDVQIKAKRALTFENVEYNGARQLANAFVRSPLKAAALIESGDVNRWIARSLEQETLAGKLEGETGRVLHGPKNNTTVEQVVARTTILIDPTGPVRYRGIALMPSGFGNMLSIVMQRGGDVQPLAEILATNLALLWLNEQTENRATHLQTQQLLERVRLYLDKKNIGYGLERVLYELSPSQPCLSPLIKNANARTVLEALHALDAVAANKPSGEPIDRHIAAFFITRERHINDMLLEALAAPDGSSKKVIAMLTLLADAQYYHGNPELKNLAQWFVQILEPAVKRYFEKGVQTNVRNNLSKAATLGNLGKLVEVVDSPELLEGDRRQFEAARATYLRAEREIEELQGDIDDREEIERRVGQPIASAVAVILGFIAVSLVIVMSLAGIYI